MITIIIDLFSQHNQFNKCVKEKQNSKANQLFSHNTLRNVKTTSVD